jgi:hypothetical protein
MRGGHLVGTGHDVHAENTGDDGKSRGQETGTEKERDEVSAGCRGHSLCSFLAGPMFFKRTGRGFLPVSTF